MEMEIYMITITQQVSAAYKSSSFDRRTRCIQSDKGSGCEVGNIFYEQGLIVLNDTGSYRETGFGTSYTLKYQITHKQL